MSGETPDRNAITFLPREEYRAAIGQRYDAGETPWDSGKPDAELVRCVAAGDLPGRTLLELGCGTGTNAIELARRGYRVKGVELASLPVERAREKAHSAGVEVEFVAGDLTKLDLGGPFDCLVDVGLYHGIRNRDLPGLLATVRRVSRRGTRWLCLAGNGKERTPRGPPVVQEEEFRAELEPLFEILRVREFRFDLRPDLQPLAWSILMQRR